MVVCRLNKSPLHSYAIGFPAGGGWREEVFNSDIYDREMTVTANGSVYADGPPLHGLPASAALAIPANGLLVFARGWRS